MHFLGLPLLPAFIFVNAALGQGNGSHNLTAFTLNGPIVGHFADNHTSVAEYLGVPYAQPPVGPLRFAAPQKSTQKSTFVASQFSATCPQTPPGPVAYPDETPQGPRILSIFGDQLNDTYSEDCLTLNMWSSVARSATTGPKPVLVLFYGGRWTIGATSTPFYNGARLAATEPIIVVSLNYRVNIFGFPGIPDMPSNLGLLDQRLAVEWLRDNIHAFGGDASRITIIGQSAGSVAVDYWNYAYAHDPIVAGMISHSGTALSFPTNTRESAALSWYNVSGMLGCGDSGDVLPCMRSQPFSAIEVAAAKLSTSAAVATGKSTPRSSSPFQPTVDNKNVFSPDSFVQRARTGRFARLPYLLGNNDNEAGYYRIPSFAITHNASAISSTQWNDFNLADFTCPVAFSAAQRARYGVPVWAFRYLGDWANLRLYPGSGAYHGSDMEMLFGNGEFVSGLPDEEAEKETERLIMRAWAAFVADPAGGLEKMMGWRRFDHDGTLISDFSYWLCGILAFLMRGLLRGYSV